MKTLSKAGIVIDNNMELKLIKKMMKLSLFEINNNKNGK